MRNQCDIPALEDINEFDSLDERTAVEHFLGKDLQQAEAMFRAGFEIYTEDFVHMGTRAFCYYVRAAIAYLTRAESRGDDNGVFYFCSALEVRLDQDWEEIQSAHRVIREGIPMILAYFRKRHFDPDAYPDVPARFQFMLTRLGG